MGAYMEGEIQGAVFTYGQSDEISFLLHNYQKLDTDSWFGNEVQKMASVAAGMASAFFSLQYSKPVVFDARVFVLPENEVANYFIWRQMDASRNSINMVAQTYYSHKELMGKSNAMKHDMLMAKGINWNDFPTMFKRGWSIKKGMFEPETPLFTQNRAYIEDVFQQGNE